MTMRNENPGQEYPPMIDAIEQRLQRLEAILGPLLRPAEDKSWFSTAEVASMLGKTPATVRAWANGGRIHAEKRPTGRGLHKEWMISAAELTRIRNEGLRPAPRKEKNRPSDN